MEEALGHCEDGAADAGGEPVVGSPEKGTRFAGVDGGVETCFVVWYAV